MNKKDINWYLLCRLCESFISQEEVKTILELGASVDAINPINGESALMQAIKLGNFSAAYLFLEKVTQLNKQDKVGMTALMHAVKRGPLTFVKSLIDKGADINITDNSNKRAIDHCVDNEVRDYLKLAELKALGQQIIDDEIVLFDVEKLENEIENGKGEAREHYLELLKKSGSLRQLISLSDTAIEELKLLALTFPNFKEVITYLLKQCRLCMLTAGKPIRFDPILLAGPPGIGKTRFCIEVSNILNVGFGVIPCNTVTAGFVIAGSTSSWRDARPGKVHELLRDNPMANPIVLLDELDKISGDSRYDPFGPLYSLLEKKTAEMFVDEFIGIPLDHSYVNWIATANDLASIPEPILSRFNVITLPELKDSETKAITVSIYNDLLKENSWGKRFSDNINDDVIKKLSAKSPRQIKKILVDGCGRAAMSRECDVYDLMVEDIDLGLTKSKPSIGFTS